jgi:hypothetical protein
MQITIRLRYWRIRAMLEMKARCDQCGEEFDMEYMGLGMFEKSQAMADHEATHEERVVWNYQGAKDV